MKLKTIIASAAATALVAMPTIAQATPANPTASLSIGKSVRASTPAKRGSKLGGGAGGIAAAVIAAGIVAIGVIAVVKDDDSDSN